MRFDFQMRPDNHGRFVVRYKDLLSEVPSAHIPRTSIPSWGKLSSLPAAALVRRGRTAVLQPGHAMLCALSWTAASAALSTDSSGLAASLRVQNQAGQWQATLELFRAAKAGGADRSSYTEAIVAHGRLRQSDKALNVFREMQDAGLTPNVVSCAQRAWAHCPTASSRSRPAHTTLLVRRHGHDRRVREPEPLADRALALLRHASGRCHARRLRHQRGPLHPVPTPAFAHRHRAECRCRLLLLARRRRSTRASAAASGRRPRCCCRRCRPLAYRPTGSPTTLPSLRRRARPR